MPGRQVSVSPDFARPTSDGGADEVGGAYSSPPVGAKSRMNDAIDGWASSV